MVNFMEIPNARHNTFVIERSYRASPERFFAALTDPVEKRRWFAEGDGHDVDIFEMDFRIGGMERGVFRFRAGTPVAGMTCLNQGQYLDIVPGRRIVIASTMTVGEHRISASLLTFEIFEEGAGGSLVLTHQGVFFEGADGPEMRQAGWNKILERLADAIG